MNALHQLKSLLRPIARHRFLIERLKFIGQAIDNPQQGNDRIARLIHKPGAVGKIGATEMKVARTYLRGCDRAGMCASFGRYAELAHVTAGIYPPDGPTLSRFARLFLDTLGGIDLLAVWFQFGEAMARRKFAPRAHLCSLTALEPFYHARPWSAQLAGKRVVVVSPFERSIESQYGRREQIWPKTPQVLPEFDLRIVRCPQPAGIIDQPEHPDWFTGLEALKDKLAAAPFDVAIVGAGAWSLPLVTHAKSLGAFGIHLGGATQLLFGITGGRWDASSQIAALRNDAWIRPSEAERPAKFRLHENGSYW